MAIKYPILPEDDHTVKIGKNTFRFTRGERGWDITCNGELIASHISSYTRAYEIAMEEIS